jgi:D-proline reductase (dithiol) PrdB
MYEEKFAEWVAKIGGLHASFAHLPIGEVPWAPLRLPLSECRLALVTTGGVHRHDQPPFDQWNEDGDWTFREIPADTPADALKISHVHYAHEDADRDINCVFPLDRVRELQREGAIGSVSPVHFSFMGYIPDPRELFAATAPAVARRLKELGVDAVLMTSG